MYLPWAKLYAQDSLHLRHCVRESSTVWTPTSRKHDGLQTWPTRTTKPRKRQSLSSVNAHTPCHHFYLNRLCSLFQWKVTVSTFTYSTVSTVTKTVLYFLILVLTSLSSPVLSLTSFYFTVFLCVDFIHLVSSLKPHIEQPHMSQCSICDRKKTHTLLLSLL